MIRVFFVVLDTLIKVKATPGQRISTFEKDHDSGQILLHHDNRQCNLFLKIESILGSRYYPMARHGLTLENSLY